MSLALGRRGLFAFSTTSNSVRIDVGTRTDVGCVRESNEDSFRVLPELNLFILSDGLGGQAHGEVASSMAVEAIADHCRASITNSSLPLEWEARHDLSAQANRLATAVLRANRLIHEAALADESHRGMATTVVSLWVHRQMISLVNVGDSRAYRFRAGVLEQLTRDHSIVAEQVRMGMITAEEAERSPMQTMLTRAVGAQPSVEMDVEEHSISNGDTFLLCSDGLSRMVSDEIIAGAIQNSRNPQSAADRLVELAREAGGLDNITVVCVRLEFDWLTRLRHRVQHR
jgi:PPM family protein phosphatase